MGATAGTAGYFIGGFGGALPQGRIGGAGLSSRFARTLQGKGDYPGIDRFKDIVLKKGKLIYAASRPGQFLYDGQRHPAGRRQRQALSIEDYRLHRTGSGRCVRNMRAYEVVEDTPRHLVLHSKTRGMELVGFRRS